MAKRGNDPKIRLMTEADVLALHSRIDSNTLTEDDKEILKNSISNEIWMVRQLEQNQLSIRRLKRAFGIKSEKQRDLFNDTNTSDKGKSGDPSQGEAASASSLSSGKGSAPKKKLGHGKTGSEDYPNAKTIFYPHESLKKGDRCPECDRGRLIIKEPGSILKLIGQAPIVAEIHQPEKLRCTGCQEYFTAKVPEHINNGERLDPTAKSMCALLKYGAGMPFYRLSQLQRQLGHLLPPSTQWDAVEDVANAGLLVFLRMLRYAAENGKLFQNDDTGAKILALKKELREKNAERQGIYTTGILVKTDLHEIAVFMTGNKNAGEHLDVLLNLAGSRDLPLRLMSDASSSNLPTGFEFLEHGKCLDHARRKFVDVVSSGLDINKHATYFIRTIAYVYRVDQFCKNLTLERRLNRHQKYSLPVMEKLQRWARQILEQKEVDAESGLGQALRYFLKHYPELTAFTRLVGMPISNIDLERLLKVPILNRKNAYFYRSLVGARVGDLLMSLIETCRRAGESPYEYLTELQRCRSDVSINPELWLPWNYKSRLAEVTSLKTTAQQKTG